MLLSEKPWESIDSKSTGRILLLRIVISRVLQN